MPIINEFNAISHLNHGSGQAFTLIIGDEKSGQIFLRRLLEAEGYQVVEADNGPEAIACFQVIVPDIIFMDVMVPEKDGYELVNHLETLGKNRFIPIIFLAEQTNENALARCIEAGGHDFLTKPVSKAILKTKVRSIERIRQLHHQALQLHSQIRIDQEMAKTVFNGAVIAENIELNCLKTILKPAEQFSGDVLLSAHAPSGDAYFLLGDFTGHGLAAALGALPAAEVFRAMTAKGFTPHQVISGINQKLHTLLPTGMFFAVQFVSISHDLEYINVVNCGMPDILLLDGKSGAIKQQFSSNSLPLGISPDIQFQELFVRAKITCGDRILLVSDGVSEARNPDNHYFGRSRFEQALQNPQPGESALESVSRALTEFCQNAPQDDDISLAEIPCIPDVLPNWTKNDSAKITPQPSSQHNNQTRDNGLLLSNPLEFSITLPGDRLSNRNPIPLLINHIQEMEGLQRHRRLLFTLLTELFVNALDHGLLRLDSAMKSSPEGFSAYFSEREKRLEALDEGYIKITIQTRNTTQGGKLRIRVEDSGDGFDLSLLNRTNTPSTETLCGRGIHLLYSLCESVRYEEPGNKVEVVYSWKYAEQQRMQYPH